MTEEIYQKIYDQAIRFLNIKMHSVGELQEKLQRKKFSKTAIRKVLRELERLDFLNDERYAQIFVENLKQYKNAGFFGIKAKLHQKKIPTAIIERVLGDFYPLEEEVAVARRFVKKLSRQGRKSYEKVARSLVSKGFRTEVTRAVLNEIFYSEKS